MIERRTRRTAFRHRGNRPSANRLRPAARACGGVRIHEVSESRDSTIAEREDHRPIRLDDLAGGLDPLAFVAEDHYLVPLGEVLPRFELLELGRLTEGLEELRHLLAPAVDARVRQLRWCGDPPFDLVA